MSKRPLSFVLFFALFCLGLTSQAQTIQLRLLSYNVKGLPTLINPQYHEDRFKEIGLRLAKRMADGTAPDIVVIQEAFGPRTIDIEHFAGYPYVLHGPGAKTQDAGGAFHKPFGSGLIILSRFPLQNTHHMSFSRHLCGTWDCFAAKGAVEAEVILPNIAAPLTLLNTHMQSDEHRPSYDAERIAQFKELAAFVNPLAPYQGALIMAGDFNSNPSDNSFNFWKGFSGLKNEGEVCMVPESRCTIAAGTDPIRVYQHSEDQVFFNDGQSLELHVNSVARNFSELFNGRSLSDHLGLETVFSLTVH